MQPKVNKPKINQEYMELPGNPSIPFSPFQIYEVIRIIDEIPLFLEEHIERLYNTAIKSGVFKLPDYDTITKLILKTISYQERTTGNIKLIFTIIEPNRQPNCDLNFIPHFYPSRDNYASGVKAGLMEAERPNPQLKIVYADVRNKADLLILKEKVFEVLLVDHNGNITEGSRSNVFFVKNNQLFTSPDEKVLNGITRGKILKLCAMHNIQITKKDIPVTGLEQFEGVFLTGSSPKVLPVSAIGGIHFNPSAALIRRIMLLYDKEIIKYLALHKQVEKVSVNFK